MRKRFVSTPLILSFVLLVGCNQIENGLKPSPSYSVELPHDYQAVVRQDDFSITYNLEGITESSESVPIQIPNRAVLNLEIAEGEPVSPGQLIGESLLPEDIREELREASSNSRINSWNLSLLESSLGPVTAPIGGVFTESQGEASIVSSGLDVVVDLTPIQALRLSALPFSGEATVETIAGPRSADCAAIWIEGWESGTPRLHCRLPSYIETVAGLRSSLVIQSTVLEDVLLVPVLYVGFNKEEDAYVVYLEDSNGSGVQAVLVDLGPSDGAVRVVYSDLPVGATLVQPDEYV